MHVWRAEVGGQIGVRGDVHPPDVLTCTCAPNPKASSAAKAWALGPYLRRDPGEAPRPLAAAVQGQLCWRGAESPSGWRGDVGHSWPVCSCCQ